jgi:1,4-alpha-glucan branching enzyme
MMERVLNQAARELLLAQASDWAFMIKTGNHRAYAERRIKTHLNRFHQLLEQVRRNKIDEKILSDMEEKDNLFSKMDYRIFQNFEK